MPASADDVLDRAIRRGTKFSRRGFTLYVLKAFRPPAPRIVISQKVDKRAVVRNKLRRRIRSILAKENLTSRAIVIITRKELISLSYPQLRAELNPVLTQIK